MTLPPPPPRNPRNPRKFSSARLASIRKHPREGFPASQRRGAALLLVLIAVAMATVLSVTFMVSSEPSSAIASNATHHAEARAVAESGLTTAIEYLRNSDTWRDDQTAGVWLADQSFGPGVFHVMFDDDDGDLTDDVNDTVVITARGVVDGVSHTVRAVVEAPPAASDAQFEVGAVVLGGTPQSVSLINRYVSPVIVCTPNYTNNTVPIVVRISSYGATGFTAYLQNPSGSAVVAETVTYMVMEEGAWEVNGWKFEAQKYTSTVTDENNSWVGQEQAYLQSYTDPVVIGQVMSDNDAGWSVFWSRGSSRTRPPSDSVIYTGKTVCEDSEITRLDETLGFIVFEQDHVTINDVAIDAKLSPDGLTHIASTRHDAPYGTAFGDVPEVVLASMSAVDGVNGGWAVTLGDPNTTAVKASIAIDEDQIKDSERNHTTEQAAVIAFETPMAYPDGSGEAAQLVALYEFNEVPVMPGLVGHWPLDEGAGGGGLASGDKIHLKNNARVDSYDSSAGAYGGANILSDAVVATNHTGSSKITLNNNADLYGNAYVGVGGDPASGISTGNGAVITGARAALEEAMAVPTNITLPGGMPANEGDYEVSGSQTFSSDRHFDGLELKNNATLTIDGHVTILCHEKFQVDNNARIILDPGATLKIYVDDEVEFKNGSKVNNDSARPDDFQLFIAADEDLLFDNNAIVAGRIQTQGPVEIKNNAVVYGSLSAGGSVTLDNNAKLHLDQDLPSVTGVKPPMEDAAAGNHGAYTVGGTLGGGGAIAATGTSVRFDGVDDYAVIPHHDGYLLGAGALSLWFKTEDRSKFQGIFSKDSTYLDTGGHLTVLIDGGYVKTRFQSTHTTWQYTAAAPVQNDTWHHLVFTWGPNKMRLYVDGAEVGDPYDYIGGLGDTSGDIGNYEPIVLGANSWLSDDLQPTPVRDHFVGSLDDVRLYDQALDAAQVQNLATGNDPGPSSFPGYVVEDTSGYGDALNMTVQDTDAITWIDGGGLTFDSATSVVSDALAAKITDQLQATGQMTLQAIFTPANITQDGPARLVSLSGGASARNFMLGQEDDEAECYLRTTDTGSSGTPEAASGALLVAGQQHEVTVTADGGVMMIYVDGQLAGSQVRTGDYSNWDSAYRLLFASEDGGGHAWLGTLHRVAIYDQALNTGQVSNIASGLPPGAGAPGSFDVTWTEQP